MRLFVSLILISALTAISHGEVKRKIQAVSTATAPVIDGDLSDAAWKLAPHVTTFTDYMTGDGVADQTIVSVLYDEKNIYVAFECRDSHPEAVRARETVRDSKFQNSNGNGPFNTEDNVEIDLDPFLTHSYLDVTQFSVNAIGTRSAAFAGGRGAKAEWSGAWEAAAKRTPTGWTAEMRIPWSVLNYPDRKDAITMGLNFYRYIDRTKGMQEWSRTGPQGFLENEGLWVGVNPPQRGFHRTLSLLPYLLAGESDGATAAKVGIDGRYAASPQLTAVGSIEPDFSNIEGAIQTIQFSHVTPYLNDVRPFFVEGGNYFQPNVMGSNIGSMLYSEQIPTFDVGAKLFGKLTNYDTIGALDTYDYDGRNDSALRYLHTFNPTSSGGFMIVNKDAPGDDSSMLLADDHQRWGKVGIDLIGATSDGSSEVAQTGGGAQLVNAYYSDKVVTSAVQYSAISSNFYTPDSYVPYTGYKGLMDLEFGSWQWQHGFWREADFGAVTMDWATEDGARYYQGVQSSFDIITRSDWYFELDYNDDYFLDTHDFNLGGQIFEGYTNRFFQLGLKSYTGETASVADTYWAPTVKLRVLKKLDVLYSAAVQNRAGLEQQHIATLNYEISPTRSFGGRIVNTNGDTNVYLFYRNSGGKGTEIYFLFGDPNALRTQRSLQVKFVFAI